ncbi:PglL family O-oligosaccharyltransferase [Acinetobacter sp. MB5]|uniref:PglL family O-oligosaccharyltransferase n=1 Tax=Acinetobacter sp. MB5 TaxID=2069438 RepID=UPI000DD020E2|nr:O-antigen ligase family protein [Acinetobacter sp. MB5]
MMQRILFLVIAVLLALSWLSPYHYTPWLTFSSELFAYAAALCTLALYIDKPLYLPKLNLPLFAIACIPFVQWVLGIEFYFNKALLSGLYLFAFAMMVVLGFNLTQDPEQREKIFKGWSLLVFVVGLITVGIALLQWLHLDHDVPGIMPLRGNRPYGNFAQPNNMATFLMMSLMGALYLFEKRVLPTWLVTLGALLLTFTIALSQSRTPWVACVVLSAYLFFKLSAEQRFKRYHVVLWVGLYVGSLLAVPMLNTVLVHVGLSHSEMSDVIERASSSHSRFSIWMQMVYAIQQHPLLGYGWNQTSYAQLVGADFLEHNERTNSAHNLILELLVWNGVILGTAIVGFVAWWIWKLNKQVKKSEALVATLMVCCVLIHAMFEFPQDYAYFLLPVGFLLGVIQAHGTSFKTFKWVANFNTAILVICILLYGLIWRDYLTSIDALNQGRKHSDQGIPAVKPYRIYVLDQFDQRADWYYLNRFSSLTPQQLERYHHVVVITPTHYDLYKYAQLLAYNGQMKEAEHQLELIHGLYQVSHPYGQLLLDQDHNGHSLH